MVRVSALLPLLALTVASLALVACNSDEDDQLAQVTPTATLTLTASPEPIGGDGTSTPTTTPSPTATTAPGPRRTGIAELDLIIAAVEERDMVTLSSLVEYQEIGCTRADGLGGPPKCPPGIDDGTPLRVFPVASCEGHWSERATQLIGFVAHSSHGLYAAVEPSGDTTLGGEWPAADHFLVFHLEQFDRQLVGRLHIADGKIVAYWSACGAGEPPERLLDAGVEGAVEVIAGPWADPAPIETAVPTTGITAVDGILAAVARYEWSPLFESAERAMQQLPPVACVAVATFPGDVECDPAKGEQPGDLVSVFPVAYCEGALARQPYEPLRAFLNQVPQLYAVVEAPAEPSPSDLYRHGAYWLVYELAGEHEQVSSAARLHVTEDGDLTILWFGCLPPVEELVQWEREPLPRVEVKVE